MDFDILINKDNRVDSSFIPDNLVNVEAKLKGSVDPNRKILLVGDAYNNFLEMQIDAHKAGVNIDISSGYRSYSYQEKVFNHYLESIGLEQTQKRVALPGASDHHSGLAMDYFSFRKNEDGSIYPYTDIKEDDREFKWMKDNCYRYGFIIRYPKGKENITNVMFEPWHIRYVGVSLATQLFNSNKTLEEYHMDKRRIKRSK